ncbi:MAG: peptide chain release factor N(5)-glutamine methyltransferase [Clostridia bacterium]|nr:peptide chain release factor N(5)-glutamine methyltransferase [Clostridia bacterium]
MVIRELIKETSLSLSSLENYMFESHLIVRTVLKKSPMDLVLSHQDEVGNADIETVRSYAKRRLLGEPLQYILGSWEFMGLEFFVEKNVLIPRSDTEVLVETALRHIKKDGATVLDIGAGSGAVGLAIAKNNDRVYLRGLDVSDDALRLSKKNAENLELDKRAIFQKCDILKDNVPGKYDVIVSNPPYIKTDVIPTLMTEVKDFEPNLALDGGADGLIFYRRITEIAPSLLNKRGLLAFEIGFDQADAVSDLMKENFRDINVIQDLSGNDRVVSGILK